jgi:Right handed beta helix region
MRKITLLFALLAAMLLPALYPTLAQATNYHSWVSHGGLDTNNCTAASPCATFAHALSQTYDGGEVSCVDSGSFNQFTVTLAVTIDCNGTVATPSADTTGSCTDGIVINAPGKVVTLRGLNVSGFNACETNGILIQAATAVYIEDCVIEKWPQQGILDMRASGTTRLAIRNTIVRNNTSAGIVVAAAPVNSVVLENVHSVGNLWGVAVGAGDNVVISRSVMSENANAGIEADPGAQVAVDNTEISHNGSYGIEALGTVVLANSDIFFNVSSISGPTLSYGNNRLFGNGGGTAPTRTGGASTDFGQQ